MKHTTSQLLVLLDSLYEEGWIRDWNVDVWISPTGELIKVVRDGVVYEGKIEEPPKK